MRFHEDEDADDDDDDDDDDYVKKDVSSRNVSNPGRWCPSQEAMGQAQHRLEPLDDGLS